MTWTYFKFVAPQQQSGNRYSIYWLIRALPAMETSQYYIVWLCFHNSSCLSGMKFKIFDHFGAEYKFQYISCSLNNGSECSSCITISNTTPFDKQISNTFGYVLQCHKVDQVVKEWEIRRKSSFTLWMAETNFRSIGVSLHIYSFITRRV